MLIRRRSPTIDETDAESGIHSANWIPRVRLPSFDRVAHFGFTFAPGGDTLLVTDNIFQGKVRTIAPATGCTNVTVRQNVGATFMNETNSP